MHKSVSKPKVARRGTNAFIASIRNRILAMTPEQRRILVTELIAKADRVMCKGYGAEDCPGDNLCWSGDLLHAAGIIRRLEATPDDIEAWCISPSSRFGALNRSEAEEIEAILP